MRIGKIAITMVFVFLSAQGQAAVRAPVFSGSFYPDNPIILEHMVSGFIQNADIDGNLIKEGELIGFISPHAGYPYSGPVAGYDFRLLQGLAFDTIIIMGPNHRARGFDKISVWNGGDYQTPLGKIEVDRNLAKAIISADPEIFGCYPQAHRQEHSIEVQLPFLQATLQDFKIVPVVMGNYSPDICRKLAETIIQNTRGQRALIIASSDLFYDKPYQEAVTMDKYGLQLAAGLDINGLIRSSDAGQVEMCGLGPVLTLLYIVKQIGGSKGVVLKYENSGDVTGDKKGRIVGYGAVAYYKKGEIMNNDEYTNEEKKELLKLARKAVNDRLGERQGEEYDIFSPKFREERGVFVTLHKKGLLRGCIGYIEPIKPLQDAVIDNAVNAAVNDSRFPKVTSNEMNDIDIEISVLTPPELIEDPGQFIPGRHGIIIRKGFRSAVFLPQVATEQGWTREETLNHLCRKAGLPGDEWRKSGMEFRIFSAEVFGEKDSPPTVE